ncbi:MAG: c-type cytochrome, partial [Chloroflexota bacterium]|nr:c-type cytochrome [Chloroflexota bacterium]
MRKPWYHWLYVRSPISKVALGIASVLLSIVVLLAQGWMEERRMQAQAANWDGRSIEKGAEIFANNCYTCHGADGKGLSGVAPAINSRYFFTQRMEDVGWTGTLHDYIALTVAAGRPSKSKSQWANIMPTWGVNFGGQLRDDQVEYVTQFVLNWEADALKQSWDPQAVAAAADVAAVPVTTTLPMTTTLDVTVTAALSAAVATSQTANLTSTVLAAPTQSANITAAILNAPTQPVDAIDPATIGATSIETRTANLTGADMMEQPSAAAPAPEPAIVLDAWQPFQDGPSKAPTTTITYTVGMLGAAAVGRPVEVAVSNTTTATAAVPAGPRSPQTLYTAMACIGCHKLDQNQTPDNIGQPGPHQGNLYETAATRVAGQDAETYVYTSIVDPAAYVVPGYVNNIMPQTFKEQMSEEEIRGLVQWMLDPN